MSPTSHSRSNGVKRSSEQEDAHPCQASQAALASQAEQAALAAQAVQAVEGGVNGLVVELHGSFGIQNAPPTSKNLSGSYRSPRSDLSTTCFPRSGNNVASAIFPVSEPVPRLQNFVSEVDLGCKLDLKRIARKAKNARYNPERHPAVVMWISKPNTTSLIFKSGKMVCTGAKTEEDSRFAARKFAKIIQKLGYPAKFNDFKIVNVVGSCEVKFPIRLEALNLAHSHRTSYEPELFPGLIYRMADPEVSILVFGSGKVVLTGAKRRHDVNVAFDKIYPILKNFMRE